MSSQFSITARLMLMLTCGLSLLWCGASAYSTYVSYHELNEAFDRTLQETARSVMPLAADDILGHESDDGRALDHFIEGRKAHFSYQLRDSGGKVVLRSHDAPSEPYRHEQRSGFGTEGHYRVYTESDEATGLSITVAETTSDRHEAIFGAVKAILLPLLALVPLTILGVWLSIRRAMKPVLRLSGAISQRSGKNLTPLDLSGQPKELLPIATSVASLMERLHAALDAERAFAANSAHELRTPIAGALAQTQMLMAQARSPQDKTRAAELESTLKKLSNLAEKLMQLSRADAGIGRTAAEVDLAPVFDMVVGDCAKRLSDPQRLKVSRPETYALPARMDMDAFAISLRNLIDNALNHGAETGAVEVIAEKTRIRVLNHGAVVPLDTLAKLKQRFARGQSRSSGSGLGLTIADTLISQAGGSLELLSPASGRTDGFEARLNLAARG